MLYQLSYGPLCLPTLLRWLRHAVAVHGQGRNRTADTAIFSRVLYQLSYLAQQKTRLGDRAQAGRRERVLRAS